MSIIDWFRPKWKHSNREVRLAAVLGLTDQSILADTAKFDQDTNIRIAAVARVADQNLLVNIAKTDKDEKVRALAVEHVTNPTVLTDISKTDKVPAVRKAAMARVTDQTVLADIAKRDKYGIVGEVAVARVTDQVMLADIAENATSMRVIRKAKIKLLDISRAEQQSAIRRNLGNLESPEDRVAATVWAWLIRNEGKLVYANINQVAEEHDYPCSGSWHIDLPVSLDPVQWIIPVASQIDNTPTLELARTGRLGYHEVKASEVRLEYRAGVSGHWYGGKDGNDFCRTTPEEDPKKVLYWKTYCFQLICEKCRKTRDTEHNPDHCTCL